MNSSRIGKSIMKIINKSKKQLGLPLISPPLSPARRSRSFNPCYFHKVPIKNKKYSFNNTKSQKNQFISHVIKTDQSMLERASDFYSEMLQKIQNNQKNRGKLFQRSQINQHNPQRKNTQPTKVRYSYSKKNKYQNHINPEYMDSFQNIRNLYNKLRQKNINKFTHLRKGSVVNNLYNKAHHNQQEQKSNSIAKTQSLAQKIIFKFYNKKQPKAISVNIQNPIITQQQFKPKGQLKIQQHFRNKRNIKKYMQRKKIQLKKNKKFRNPSRLNGDINAWDYQLHQDLEQIC